MRWKRRPRDKAEACERLRQFVSNLRAIQGQAGRNPLDVDRANRLADAVDAYLEGRAPSMDVALDLQRPEAEAREWLKQFAGNLRELRGIQKEHFKALWPMIKTAGHASPVWIDPEIIPLHSDLADWMIDAIDAYTLENQTTRNRRARSMDVALGLKRPAGRLKGTQRDNLQTAIHIHYLLLLGESWEGIAERLGHNEPDALNVRNLQRIYETHRGGIIEHLIRDGFVPPLGYDLKDGELVINESEATTVRMIFERFAKVGSVRKLMLDLLPHLQLLRLERNVHLVAFLLALLLQLIDRLRAEGITDEGGKPIDERYLYRLLNNPSGAHVSRQAQGNYQPDALEQSSQDFTGGYARVGVKNPIIAARGRDGKGVI